MISLNLPSYPAKIRTVGDRRQIYDVLRRRYVALTPEEWVRQHFVHFLVNAKGYPLELMGNEVGVNVNGVARRCDTVVYHREGARPRVIIEYKAPHITITQQVFTQIAAYNSKLRADVLIVSNGMQHFACRMLYDVSRAEFLADIPDYSAL